MALRGWVVLHQKAAISTVPQEQQWKVLLVLCLFIHPSYQTQWLLIMGTVPSQPVAHHENMGQTETYKDKFSIVLRRKKQAPFPSRVMGSTERTKWIIFVINVKWGVDSVCARSCEKRMSKTQRWAKTMMLKSSTECLLDTHLGACCIEKTESIPYIRFSSS